MLVLAAVLSTLLVLCVGQKPCCTPDQWEGTVLELQGYLVDDELGTVDGTIKVSYDYTNQKLALTENLNETNTGLIKLKVIQDYKKGMQYAIQDNMCRKTVLMGPMRQQCIPDNATHIGMFSLGGMSGGLECDSFMTTLAGMKNVYALSDVTRDGCVPVTQVSVSLMREHSTMTSTSFTDVTTGIKDPSVFSPPMPPCSNNDVILQGTTEFGSDFFNRVLHSFQHRFNMV